MSDEQSGSARRRPATRAEATALASAVRLRIIRLTFRTPLTNKEIAERLDKDPATTLYHVRKLVSTGFLAAQPIRIGARGAKEIPYLSTGLSWRLAPAGPSGDEAIREAMLGAFLGEVADVGVGSVVQTRLVLSLDEDGRNELADRVGALLEEFRARPATPDGREIGVYVATYPSG